MLGGGSDGFPDVDQRLVGGRGIVRDVQKRAPHPDDIVDVGFEDGGTAKLDIGTPNTYTSADTNSSMSRSLSWSACRICGECWSGGENAAAIQSSVTCGGVKTRKSRYNTV